MAEKPTRRTRSPHPGVVLIPPREESRHDYWRARFRDPDTGRLTFVKLKPLALPNADMRRDWAIEKSKEIARRAMDIERGAPRYSGSAFGATIGKYIAAHEHLRERTKAGYTHVANKLKAWAIKHGVTTVDELTRARLIEFRDSVIRERRRVPAKTGERGEWKPSTQPRSPHTINRELRAARTILGYLRSRDMLPRVTSDDLRDGLKRVGVTYDRVDYLKPSDIKRLLEAAIRHDEECHDLTRKEHAGLRPRGTTAKFEPIGPFIATVLLTGMRVGEALALDWRAVDLKSLGEDGTEVGEIYVAGASTKTKRGRSIDLTVSPALRVLLAALKLRSGGRGSVFRLTRTAVNAAAKRLRGDVQAKRRSKKAKPITGYGAPESFSWQALRRTCACYLVCAPGIYGAGSAYRTSKQLGNSTVVLERHYADVVRGIPHSVRTVEDAMQCADLVKAIGDAPRVARSEARSA